MLLVHIECRSEAAAHSGHWVRVAQSSGMEKSDGVSFPVNSRRRSILGADPPEHLAIVGEERGGVMKYAAMVTNRMMIFMTSVMSWRGVVVWTIYKACMYQSNEKALMILL